MRLQGRNNLSVHMNMEENASLSERLQRELCELIVEASKKKQMDRVKEMFMDTSLGRRSIYHQFLFLTDIRIRL